MINLSQTGGQGRSLNPNYLVTIQQDRKDKLLTVQGHVPENFRFGVSSSWEAPLSNGVLGMMPGAINGLLRMYGVSPSTQAMTLQIWQGNSSPEDYQMELEFTTYSDPNTDVRMPILNLLRMVTPGVDSNGMIIAPGPVMDPKQASVLVKEAASSLYKIGEVTGRIVGDLGSDLMAGIGSFITGVNYKNTPADSGMQKVSSALPGGTPAPMAGVSDTLKSSINNQIALQIGRAFRFDSIILTGVNPDCDLQYLDGRTATPNIVRVSISFRPLFMVTEQDWESILVLPKEDVNRLNEAASKGADIFNTVASKIFTA